MDGVHAAFSTFENRLGLGGSAEACVTVLHVPPELPINGDYPAFPRLFLDECERVAVKKVAPREAQNVARTEAEERGAGEILFTSMTHDGVKEGYPNEALAYLADTLHIPVIASGGAGKMEHFKDAFIHGKADAALAASVFHFGEIGIADLNQAVSKRTSRIRIRPPNLCRDPEHHTSPYGVSPREYIPRRAS